MRFCVACFGAFILNSFLPPFICFDVCSFVFLFDSCFPPLYLFLSLILFGCVPSSYVFWWGSLCVWLSFALFFLPLVLCVLMFFLVELVFSPSYVFWCCLSFWFFFKLHCFSPFYLFCTSCFFLKSPFPPSYVY